MLDYGIQNNVSLKLTNFLDSDFVDCKVDRKSTSGTCHMLGSSLISWHCKKQACVADLIPIT